MPNRESTSWSLANATSGNRSRILAPTMAEQIYAAKLLTPGAAGHEVTLHAFRNDIDEHTVVGHALIQPDGIARLTQSRPGEAVEELVAAVELQGQQFFANTPIQWVIAPPKATFVITRLDPRTVMVVTRLTRDLDPTDQLADDRSNPPIPFHPFKFTFIPGFGSPTNSAGTSDAMTWEDGQYSFTYTDLSAFPDTITVEGSLTTHLEGEPPNETPHVVQFVATTQVFDTVEVKIDPSSQGLPTREPIVGGLFSVSFPKRASIDLHHYWVAITNSFSPFAIFMATGAPTGNTDVFAIEPDSVLRATGPHGVLANDTDSDSPLTAELVIAPLHGTMAFSADGSFEYSP